MTRGERECAHAGRGDPQIGTLAGEPADQRAHGQRQRHEAQHDERGDLRPAACCSDRAPALSRRREPGLASRRPMPRTSSTTASSSSRPTQRRDRPPAPARNSPCGAKSMTTTPCGAGGDHEALAPAVEDHRAQLGPVHRRGPPRVGALGDAQDRLGRHRHLDLPVRRRPRQHGRPVGACFLRGSGRGQDQAGGHEPVRVLDPDAVLSLGQLDRPLPARDHRQVGARADVLERAADPGLDGAATDLDRRPEPARRAGRGVRVGPVLEVLDAVDLQLGDADAVETGRAERRHAERSVRMGRISPAASPPVATSWRLTRARASVDDDHAPAARRAGRETCGRGRSTPCGAGPTSAGGQAPGRRERRSTPSRAARPAPPPRRPPGRRRRSRWRRTRTWSSASGANELVERRAVGGEGTTLEAPLPAHPPP